MLCRKSPSVIAGALTVAVCLVVTAQAHATVRRGSIRFPAPTNPPSFQPQVPATQQKAAVDAFTIAYDDVAGTVSATMRLHEPAFWGARTPGAGFSLDTECTQEEGDSDVDVSDAPLLVMTFGPSRPAADEVAGDPPYAQVTRAGYEGSAQGTYSFDGTTSSATVSSPLLAGLDVRCFRFHGTDSEPYLKGGWLSSGAQSYAPLELTRFAAEPVFEDALTRKYGTAFTGATRRYVKCSTFIQTDEDEGTQSTDCMAEFRTGRTWRYVYASVTVTSGDFQASVDRLSGRRWTRRWQRHSRRCARSWRVSGTLWSNDGVCPASLAFRYFRGRTSTGGTGSGAFPRITQYRCKTRRGVIECVNAMGDAMRWRR